MKETKTMTRGDWLDMLAAAVVALVVAIAVGVVVWLVAKLVLWLPVVGAAMAGLVMILWAFGRISRFS